MTISTLTIHGNRSSHVGSTGFAFKGKEHEAIPSAVIGSIVMAVL